ncbi:MAG: NUDIX hydrolase [Bacteroidaceae bacterium]|nr:NUDIX hydrolase [Bacteroidaceae bacterium]
MIPKLENRKWKVLKSETLLNKGTWMHLRQDRVQLPSGSIVPEWFVLEFPDWVNVIAITKNGDFVMEDQYRHALGETHFELVAGVIDEGETPLEAARRELSEETGFGGGEWSLFMQLSPNPTNHTNWSYTFLATGVERLQKQHQEPTEDINIDIFSRNEVLELLHTGQIVQALHAAPLWKYFAMTPRILTKTNETR